MKSPMLTKKESAARLNLSVRGIEALMARRALAFTRLGHRTVRFTEADIDQFVAANTVKAVAV